MSELLTVQQISKRLKVTPLTVRRWLNAGQLTGISLGDRAGWRISEEELSKFMQVRGLVSSPRVEVVRRRHISVNVEITEEMTERGAFILRTQGVRKDGVEWAVNDSRALVRDILDEIFNKE